VSIKKRVLTSPASPLEDAGILLHVLQTLGPGQHLLISAVSKAWKEQYKRVADVQKLGLFQNYYNKILLTISSTTTLGSAAFASAASVSLAHRCGLAFDSDRVQHLAGRMADVLTLRAAHGLGLPLTDEVLIGAAEAASLPNLQWLHVDQACELPESICNYAARSGSVPLLMWLKEHGSVFKPSCSADAAACAHQHVLQFLRDEGCEWNWAACSAAARHGHLAILKWLHEQGCPWKQKQICCDAAESGSMEILLYLRDQGCEYNAHTLTGAAAQGHLALCEYLVAEQCPSNTMACDHAADGGYLEIVRFLHESGCPWSEQSICNAAAGRGSIEMLQYLLQKDCFLSERVMSAAAQRGHLHMCQYLYAEQCPWDTMACHSAACFGQLSTLRWLREHGCPCEVPAMRAAAAFFGYLPVLEYLAGVEPAASTAQLTEMLNDAGMYNWLSIAQWLRQQGAEWPAVLGLGHAWKGKALQWARDEGCTSPLYTQPATATAQP
jgi:hypothetical protein